MISAAAGVAERAAGLCRGKEREWGRNRCRRAPTDKSPAAAAARSYCCMLRVNPRVDLSAVRNVKRRPNRARELGGYSV
jgi:hypothetical protein